MIRIKPLHRRTSRIEVRPFILGDYGRWKFAHLTRKEPKSAWDRGPRKPKDVTLAIYKRMLRNQKQARKIERNFDLALIARETGALIGGISIMMVERGVAQTAYLGYGLFNSHWGKGYAQEAVKAAFDIAFVDLKLHRLEAGIEPQNKASLKLARRVGLRHEGCKRRALFLRNKWVDLEIYSATTEDFGVRFRGPKPVMIRRT